MKRHFIFSGSPQAGCTILLAHGAGAPMDSETMTGIAEALADVGFRVARFEFDYMAQRRTGGRKPPPKAEALVPEYRQAVEDLADKGTLIIGGKSLGGRVASMAADQLLDDGRIAGLLCLGYPFHPPKKPDVLRTAHLARLRVPTLIVQGTRDPFGNREEVAHYALSGKIRVHWLEDGDHDFRPRKSVSGLSLSDNIGELATVTRAWAASLTS